MLHIVAFNVIMGEVTVSTGKYYTVMNASSFGTFPNDRFRLGDHLTQVTAGSGSTVFTIKSQI